MRLIRYDLHREPSQQAHHYVRTLEAGVLHGQAVARVLLKLKAKGFVPNVVIAHPGWGEALSASRRRSGRKACTPWHITAKSK